MARPFVLQLPPLNGGLNTSTDPTRIATNQAYEMRNCNIRGEEVLIRGGTEQYSSTISITGRCTGLTKLLTSGGTKQLITGHDTSLYMTTSSAVDWKAIKTGLTADSAFESVMYLDELFFVNGFDSLGRYDGTTWTDYAWADVGITLGTEDEPHLIEKGIDRIFLANDKTLWWSLTGLYSDGTGSVPLGYPDFGDTGSGSTQGLGTFGENDGSTIAALKWWNDRLYVFKKPYGIYTVSFDTSGNAYFETISTGVGCLSQRSLQQVGNNLIFLSADGVRTFGQPKDYPSVEHYQDISRDIRKDIINEAKNTERACAWYYGLEGRYMLSFSVSGSYNNLIACYFAEEEYLPWTIYTNLKPAAFIEFQGELIYAADNEGKVYKMETETYADVESKIDFSIWVRRNANAQGQRLVPGNKIFKAARFDTLLSIDGELEMEAFTDIQKLPYSTGLISVTASYEGEGTLPLGQGILGQEILGGGYSEPFEREILTSKRLPIGKSGKFVDIHLSNITAGDFVSLLGTEIEVVNKSPLYLQ